MSKFLLLVATAAISITTLIHRTPAKSTSPAMLVVDRVERSFGRAGELRRVDHVTERIRHDGSRSITILRTIRSETSTNGWETHEGWRLYDATSDVAHEVFPALGLYGSLPVGREKFRKPIAVRTCRGVFPAEANPQLRGSVSRFGKTAEVYRVEFETPETRWIVDVEVFPEFGCLEGNKTLEVWQATGGERLSRRVVELVSVTTAPEDLSWFRVPTGYAEAKPSEILRRHAERTGKVCSECASGTATLFDERHRRLWEARHHAAPR
ncbi:MAG: hypothetical protein RMK57_08805 [Bryobacterales bacterium]|nr:hypothetical protein [Bryobacteraceae bacterium]MDW8354615.1 hypothetical protein [Bryobacterales bacterium]